MIYIYIMYIIYIHMDDNRVGLHLSFYPKALGLLSSTFNRFALLAPASKSILKSCKSPAWLAWLQVELASWLGKKSQKKTSLACFLTRSILPAADFVCRTLDKAVSPNISLQSGSYKIAQSQKQNAYVLLQCEEKANSKFKTSQNPLVTIHYTGYC